MNLDAESTYKGTKRVNIFQQDYGRKMWTPSGISSVGNGGPRFLPHIFVSVFDNGEWFKFPNRRKSQPKGAWLTPKPS